VFRCWHVVIGRDKPLAGCVRWTGIFLAELLVFCLPDGSANYVLIFIFKSPDMNVVILVLQSIEQLVVCLFLRLLFFRKIGTVLVINNTGRDLERDGKVGKVFEITLPTYFDNCCAGAVEIDSELLCKFGNESFSVSPSTSNRRFAKNSSLRSGSSSFKNFSRRLGSVASEDRITYVPPWSRPTRRISAYSGTETKYDECVV
jgi:hypothetical protein